MLEKFSQNKLTEKKNSAKSDHFFSKRDRREQKDRLKQALNGKKLSHGNKY